MVFMAIGELNYTPCVINEKTMVFFAYGCDPLFNLWCMHGLLIGLGFDMTISEHGSAWIRIAINWIHPFTISHCGIPHSRRWWSVWRHGCRCRWWSKCSHWFHLSSIILSPQSNRFSVFNKSLSVGALVCRSLIPRDRCNVVIVLSITTSW